MPLQRRLPKRGFLAVTDHEGGRKCARATSSTVGRRHDRPRGPQEGRPRRRATPSAPRSSSPARSRRQFKVSGIARHQGREGGDREGRRQRRRPRRRATRSKLPKPSRKPARPSNRRTTTLSANPLATLGKLGDLKRRLWFLRGRARRLPHRDATSRCRASTRASSRASSSRTQGGILDMFNMFSGGALSRFSIFALGIMPYISASIIMQLLTVVSPHARGAQEGRRGGPAARSRSTRATAPWCSRSSRRSASRSRSSRSRAS